MALKDLFFINEDKPKKEKKESVNKFPDSGRPVIGRQDEVGVFPTGNSQTFTVTVPQPSCEPHIEKVLDMYEKGFESLNLAGYDFYELFKAVQAGGINNPTAYQMAFTMGKGMDSTVTKEKLLEQAEYYLNEINKVHKEYVESGLTKKRELETLKNTEKTNLDSEVSRLQNELDNLQNLLNEKVTAQKMLDNKYASQLNDIECKVLANDTAKNTIVTGINEVVNGIKTNIN